MKRKLWIFILILGFLFVGIGFFYEQKEKNKQHQSKEEQQQKQELNLQEKQKNYAEQVKVSKNSILYQWKDNRYQMAGTIAKDTILSLEKVENLKDTNYFQIKDSSYYISYRNVSKETSKKEERYKNYIPFPNQIKTKENTKFYGQDGQVVMQLKESQKLSIIEQEETQVWVLLFNQLLAVKKEDIQEEIETTTNQEIATSIPVINYHFIYLNGDTSCKESICHSEDQIRSHFSYLKEIDAFTITTKELEKFIDNNIQLPKKSILITIDDGARAENFIPLLEEYNLQATLFLVTSWYPKETFTSSHLELASHTHDMHTTGICPSGQGGGIKCLEEAIIQEDLKKSRETLDNTTAFCYPFYEYNDYAIEQVKKAGFTIAFIGGSQKVNHQTNKYKIPRYPIQNTTGVSFLEQLIES